MARTEANLEKITFAQQLDPEYWNWSDDDKKALGDAHAMGDVLRRRIEQQYPEVRVEALYIVEHNADVQRVWDTVKGQYIEQPKVRHVHVVCKLSGRGLKIGEWAKACGIAGQYIEKPQKGPWGYDNMLSYLIHAKDKNKAQYSPEEVVTAAGKPYEEVYAEAKERWEKGAAVKNTKRAKEDIEQLVQRILSGELTKQMIMLDDDKFDVYAQYPVRCDQAFETYGQRQAYKVIAAMESGEYKLAVFYITGKPRTGKSKLTDWMVQSFIGYARDYLGENWRKCSVASNNPLDDWNGEEVLIMDDLRGMSMTASDWLKLLDPDRVNRAGTRYKNKWIAPRVIFINAEKDVYEFFYFLKGMGGGERGEAMDQFVRRIMSKVIPLHAPTEINPERRLVNVQPMHRLEGTQSVQVGETSHHVDINFGFAENDEWMTREQAADILLMQAFGEDYMQNVHGWVKEEEGDDGEVD